MKKVIFILLLILLLVPAIYNGDDGDTGGPSIPVPSDTGIV